MDIELHGVNNNWAFAVRRPGRKWHRGVGVRDYIISACSAEAKRMGLEAGTRYDQAKVLIPDLKVILLGGR
jgi:hypothetical protein